MRACVCVCVVVFGCCDCGLVFLCDFGVAGHGCFGRCLVFEFGFGVVERKILYKEKF